MMSIEELAMIIPVEPPVMKVAMKATNKMDVEV